VGEFGIATRMVAADADAGEPALEAPPPELPLEQPQQTMIYRPPAVAAEAEDAPPPPPEREVVTLTVAGHRHEVAAPRIVLGRSRACDIRIADVNISRRHAELRQEGTSYWIVDLDSMNGTAVNGQTVQRERLRDGDTITIGSTDVVFGRSLP
jgi:FHA domain